MGSSWHIMEEHVQHSESTTAAPCKNSPDVPHQQRGPQYDNNYVQSWLKLLPELKKLQNENEMFTLPDHHSGAFETHNPEKVLNETFDRDKWQKTLNVIAPVPENILDEFKLSSVVSTLPHRITDSNQLLKVAVQFFFATNEGRRPSASDVTAILVDSDFSVDNILSQFKAVCDRQNGVENLPQIQDSRGHHSSTKGNQMTGAGPGCLEINNLSFQNGQESHALQFEDPSAIREVEHASVMSLDSDEIDAGSVSVESNLTCLQFPVQYNEDISTSESTHPDPRDILSDGAADSFQDLLSKVLQKEHELLKKSMTCVSCSVNPAEVTLLPCGHFVLCAKCSDNCNECPICHKVALAEVKTYLS